ncbi:MAG: methionyl-tRNA formyltransferase [Candidatus Omnitrophica bacterium]|nr:methionyl-tRNA formyltransferase [Candidatus Omnitrophota bacterium]
MKVTVFTSNQPRHIALIHRLATVADEVFAVLECNTVFPGQVQDFFKRTNVMQEYFRHVIEAERMVFGSLDFLPSNVRSLSLRSGDLSLLDMSALVAAFQSDYYIVFGSSYIRNELADFLVEHQAINIHMGVSPYYRGNSCNFWALYDRKPDYVGATIHLLSKGLDSGAMLFHAVPAEQAVDPFELGMLAVRAAQNGLLQALKTGELLKMVPVLQDKSLQIRYTRNSDFNDDVASGYLRSLPGKNDIGRALRDRDVGLLLRPYIE